MSDTITITNQQGARITVSSDRISAHTSGGTLAALSNFCGDHSVGSKSQREKVAKALREAYPNGKPALIEAMKRVGYTWHVWS